MIRFFSFAAIVLMMTTLTVNADVIGEPNPLTDAGTPDGWSGVTVMNGYGGIPAGQNVVSVNYGANLADGDTRHIQPLIAKEVAGAFTIWEVGPVETPAAPGVYSVAWTSSEIPNDGNAYHPAVWQWVDGVDNEAGGTIPFGEGGSGMFQSDKDGTTYVPAVGDPLDMGHASGAGGRSYQMNFETVPEPTAAVMAALAILPLMCLRRRKK